MSQQGQNGHNLKGANFNGPHSYARRMKAELERKAKQAEKEAKRRARREAKRQDQ